ncbi:MAG: efflux RND transporter periplasmic adaptor subunit [Candidatus Polarisedimenticolia bacterium]
MARRMIIMLVTVAAVLSGLAAVKYFQVQAAIAQAASFQPPPEAVTTAVVREQGWPASLAAIGTVTPVQGVTVSADTPGIVSRIAFESGRAVKKGEILVELDTRQERAQLASAQARRDLAASNLVRMEGLIKKGVTSHAEFDSVRAEDRQAEASVHEIRATIERKTIQAPFSGVLGIRQVNVGQYLESGAPIVPLQSVDPIHVNFSVPQQDAGRLSAGMTVRISFEQMPGGTPLDGKVTAVNTVVDEATRNIQVQATLGNKEGLLRPGMFVQVEAVLSQTDPVLALPATAISYAPYGDSVFVVEELTAPDGSTYRGVQQRFVKVGPARGDLVAIVSGLEAGQEVVTSGVFKLRSGVAVQVNNDVEPGQDPTPRPQDS